jgi:glucokinase
MATRIGVDIGGTKLLAALVDEDGSLLADQRIPTGPYDSTLAELVAACRRLARPDTLGIGVGCTGPLENGVVLNGDTLPDWMNRDLRSDLEAGAGQRVAMENDADAALVGELFHGAASGHRSEVVAMLTFGTGVGGAVWTGQSLYRGAQGEHPEIGHIAVDLEGPPCYCGQKGCLESLASGPAINASGDFDRARRVLASALWTLAHTFRPSLVLLGGGMIDAYGDRLVPFESLNPDQAPMLLRPMAVAQAALGNRAGVVGAARLVDLT